MNAAGIVFAGVIGAWVVVVAVLNRSAFTDAARTGVVGRAKTAVGTGQVVVGVHASLAGITTVGRA